jgi:hypothetical protein
MKRQIWLVGLAIVVSVSCIQLGGATDSRQLGFNPTALVSAPASPNGPTWLPAAQAETPAGAAPAAPTATPPAAYPVDALPGSATSLPPSPSPTPIPTSISVSPRPGVANPTSSPTASPGATPGASPTASPGATPTISPLVPGGVLPPVPTFPTAVPAAPPLPIKGEYKDPEGRFRIGILEGYRQSQLAGSVLIEAMDGSLAYAPIGVPAAIGLNNPLVTPQVTEDLLSQAAKTTFQQGESFQVTGQQSIPGGLKVDWTGKLTIAGKTQPLTGVILAKPTNGGVLLLLIAATESGAKNLPGAVTALLDSFQALS